MGAYIIAILSVFRGIIFLSWIGYGILNGFLYGIDPVYFVKSMLSELDKGNLLRNIDNRSGVAVVQVH